MMPLSAAAGEPELLMEQGNQAYNAGMYEQAAEAYGKVDLLGYRSAALCYNLGNAFFKMNQMPRAILWYERALRLDPGSEDIHHNLQVANSRIVDKIEPLPVLFYIRWFRGLVMLLPANTWALLTLIVFTISLMLAALFVASGVIGIRKAGFWGGLSGLMLAVALLMITWSSQQSVQTRSEAIIFTPVVTVKSSPGEKAVDLFPIHEGTKVILKDKIGNWYEIRIANGSVGWVPAETLELI